MFTHTFLPVRRYHPHPLTCVLTLVTAVLALPVAHAADARRAVKAKHGEMVLLREVPTRMATRQQPPGLALIVDPRPNRELHPLLGKGSQMSDSEIARLGATPVRTLHPALHRSMAPLLRERSGMLSGHNVPGNNVAAGSLPMSSAGSAGRNVGDQVRQALGSMPLPMHGGGH